MPTGPRRRSVPRAFAAGRTMQGQTTARRELRLIPLSEARHSLRELVAGLKGGNPLAPVTVVGPSNYANLSLRHALGLSGSANVRTIVLPRLAEILGAPALAASGRVPLTPLIEGAIVRAVAEGASGPLGALGHNPALHRSLRHTFRRLRHATPEAVSALEAAGPVRREVVRLLHRYRELTTRYYDREDLAASAAAAVANGKAPALKDLGAIVFYLPRRLTTGETALIAAFAAPPAGGPCAVMLGLTGDETADAQSRALVGRLSDDFGCDETPPTATGRLTRILVAPDPQQEVRWAARRIVRAAGEGTPLHRMALLFRQDDPYATLIHDEMAMAGIPTTGPAAATVGDSAVARSVMGLLRMAGSDLHRDEVMEWLTGSPVKAPGGVTAAFSPSRWDSVSRRAGIVRGPEQWRERLDRYAAGLEGSAARGVELGEMPEETAQANLEEAASARTLATFIASLNTAVAPPQSPSWEALSRWLAGLVASYVDTGAAPAQETSAMEKIAEALSEVEGLDAIDSRPTLAKFVATFEEALAAPLGHTGRSGQGVFVAPIGAAAGMEFDLVHIVGMAEGALPPRPKEDPLVPDRDRRAAGGPAAGLPLAEASLEDERYSYLAALAAAGSAVLSYPAASGQRGQFASHWLLEAASGLEGAAVYSSTLRALRDRPWLTVIASAEHALASVRTETPADAHDYDMESLWRWRAADLPMTAHPLAAGGLLSRSLALDGHRRSRALTEWDGDLSALAAASKRLDPVGRRVLSPTSLEKWAKCPYSYFLSRVLGVGEIERPEEANTISPMEKGSLVHGVLERFVGEARKAGGPRPGSRWTDEHRRALHAMAEEAFTDAEARGVTGKRLLWQLARGDILTDLLTFLEEDDGFRERFGMDNYAVEAAFGVASDSGESWPPVAVEIPGVGKVRFRGVIDRVDFDAASRTAIVIDYKTGSPNPFSGMKKHPIDRGKRLQLPIYALALRAALGDDVQVRAAYWFVSAGGKFTLIPGEPAGLETLLPGFQSAAAEIVSGIRQGLFPANPGKMLNGGFENCTFCEFTSVCQSRRDVAWQRKKAGDPRLAGYAAMAEPEGDAA